MTGVADLAEESFVSLATFRRSGEAVPTPVWVAAVDTGSAGVALVVTTGAASGKVKRLRANAEVTLQPCNRRGKVAPGAPTVTGRAEVLDDPVTLAGATAAIRAKYGWEFRVLMLVERVVARGARDRVIQIGRAHV